MISVNNISKEFNGEALFSNVTFNINTKDCIGLAGRNGAGKTTILRIITGEVASDHGEIVKPNDLEIGYLPQEKVISGELGILEEVLTVFKVLDQLKERNVVIDHEILAVDDYSSKEYQDLVEERLRNEERIRLAEPEKLRGRAERILIGLGFNRADFQKQLNTFSFGWQMRVEIAKLLLSNPFLLLLDEPTNHLDIESIQWLEDYLSNYPGSIMIVSHDRTFLDNLTNRTIEINNGKIYDYKVKYSKYIQLREERLTHQKSAFDNQQKEVKEIQRFIERFRYKNTKARQVQSRVKHLEKLQTVEIDDLDKSAIHFSFPPAPHSGKITVEGDAISKSYGDNKVLSNVDFQILKGEKIAFVGKNGEGKSTLAKIITEKVSYKGELNLGYQVQLGYYSQDQWEMLDPDLTVFQTLDNIAVGEIRKRLKTILGSFLFRGEDVDKKVKILSGGEKTRLSLAKLLLTPSNLLVLDEPTNHLDILSKDILKNALLQYDGTLIIISHDRDFLEGLTNRLYEFKNQKIKEFRGDIFDFLEKKKIQRLSELEKRDEVKRISEGQPSKNKLDWERKKEVEKKARKLKTKIKRSEEQIDLYETELNELNAKLEDPGQSVEDVTSGKIFLKYEAVKKLLDKAYKDWEDFHSELEKMGGE